MGQDWWRCSIDGCSRASHGHGLCDAHLWRLRSWGDVRADLPVGNRTDPEVRARLSSAQRAAWADPGLRERQSAAMAAAYSDPAVRTRMGAAVAAAWDEPGRRQRQAQRHRNAPVLGECSYCGGPAQTRDHVVPRSRGGSDEPSNIVLACYSCNASKGARTPEEWARAAH